MKKKLCAGLLVTSMILSSSVMAFAASGDAASDGLLTSTGTITTVTDGDITTGQTITGNGDVDPGVINVDMPTSTKIILNPYKVDGKSQVLSTVIPFKNYSNVGVKVNLVELQTTVATDMLLVEESNYNDALTAIENVVIRGQQDEIGQNFKDVKLGTIYLENYVISDDVMKVDATTEKYIISSNSLDRVGKVTSAQLLAVDPLHVDDWGAFVNTPTSGASLTLSDAPITTGKVCDSDIFDADGNVMASDQELSSGGSMYLRFNGKLNPHVTWSTGDTVTANMTFKLQPASVTVSDSLFGVKNNY